MRVVIQEWPFVLAPRRHGVRLSIVRVVGEIYCKQLYSSSCRHTATKGSCSPMR